MALQIEPRLPRFNGKGAHAPQFEELAGATLVRIGTSPDLDVEGGGLVIECRKPGNDACIHIVLGFNEVGMWIQD